jgi:hypothetical protein
MKRLLGISLLLLVGCGGTVTTNPPKPITLKWHDDGNPTVPVCQTQFTNCKYTIDIIDDNTEFITTIPVTQTSFVAGDSSHKYSIRTSGFDKDGYSIHSAYEASN